MRLVVFTDLDGTLLDHKTYSHEPALPALNTLKSLTIPLVLASSKTAAEIAGLHNQLGLGDVPAIVENGSGVYSPLKGLEQDRTNYTRIRTVLKSLPAELKSSYSGFGDMSDEGVAGVTGLPLEDARRARLRCHSEPGLWTGSEAELAEFESALAEKGIKARRGGRFLTLSLGKTKADTMSQIAKELGADTTAALGDAPNDIEMLEAADYGFIVKNNDSPGLPLLQGETNGRIRRTAKEGPEAWNEAILGLLAMLGLQQD